MQTATSETESKSLDLSICVHHYTLRAPCPKGQGTTPEADLSQPARVPLRPPQPPSTAGLLDVSCRQRLSLSL